MYYKVDIDLVSMSTSIRTDGAEDIISLFRGRPMPPDHQPTYRYLLRATEDEDEDTGELIEPVMYAYYPNVSVMEDRLIDVIENAGVDNLQVYSAVIEDEADGLKHENYKTVNVIGLVACADVAASKGMPVGFGYDFSRLVIDPSRVGDLLLFRLAEQQTEIIVHDSVAKAIEEGNFAGIVLTPLDESQP